MNGSDNSAKCIHDQLAQQGSFLTCGEIEGILHSLKGISLKLIVTNVPREVYTDNLAQETFEGLFKPLDPHCTFLYLPSFNRAQVYMTNPEAALLARLQIQGWKLPDSVLSQISPESRLSSNHEGINCFIDHVEQYDSEDDTDSGSDVEMCTCGSLTKQPFASGPLGSVEDLYQISSSVEEPLSPSEVACDIPIWNKGQPPPVTVETATSLDSIGDQQSRRVSERKPSTPDAENTSEASGDDVTGSLVPLVSRPTAPCTYCKKRNARSKKSKMQHLAPPKPPRLFLLSPPCSPPVGWEPKPECEPVINYELLEALAALSPGEAFELHPSDQEHKHPSIVITPCESSSDGPRPQIIHTRCPERNA
ncbi:Calcipressin [Opisthorchis viverrini]|nr:Calcipressin [Opisthorchis viverrini]